jgi:hypothetical protein
VLRWFDGRNSLSTPEFANRSVRLTDC